MKKAPDGAFEAVKKSEAFFDKGLTVCSRKVLSAFGGQNSHSQPELYVFREQGLPENMIGSFRACGRELYEVFDKLKGPGWGLF